MRRLLAALLFCVALPVAAQDNPPAKLQPLPEPPPPPSAGEYNKEPQPDITIRHRGKETIEEYRIGGRLYMIKVTPPGGKPYYLIDETGNGTFTRHSYAPSISPPMWVLFHF